MIELKKEEILKTSPDYEDYTENEARLTIDEIKELAGVKSKKGCCGSSGGGCCKTR